MRIAFRAGPAGRAGSAGIVGSAGLGAVLLAAAALLVPAAQPAGASCAAGTVADGVGVVAAAFVGTAGAQRRGYTRFTVDEVWKGPDLAPTVWIQTGERQPPWPISLVRGVASSADATVEPGVRYVVGLDEGYRTSSCVIWPADQPGVTAARPAAVRTARGGGADGADPPAGALEIAGRVAAAAGLVAALVLVGHRVRRRRRTAGP